MQLNELLEEHSIGTISERTMISEDNIKRMITEDFSALSKAKAMGFLSILEREYQLDVKSIKKNIVAHYDTLENDDEIVNLTHPRVEEKKGRSKWFFFLMLALLAYASWYFFTQFDKKTLNTLMPFSDDKSVIPLIEENKTSEISEPVIETKIEESQAVTVENDTSSNATNSTQESENSLVLINALSSTQKDTAGVETNIVVMDISPNEDSMPSVNATSVVATENVKEVNMVSEKHITDNTLTQNTLEETNQSNEAEATVAGEVTKVILTPVKRVWFGLVSMRTGKRDHFSVKKAFTIDLTNEDWLIATSPAPFSLKFRDEIDKYNNQKEHYFIVSKAGITELKKKAYVSKGGYGKW
jgi:cytoskeletal protein RodZ